MPPAADNQRREWMAAAREVAGHSQLSLARLLNVSNKCISYWERGISVPRPEIRPALAAALGMTVTELNRRLGVEVEPTVDNDHRVTPFEIVTSWLSVFVRLEQSSHGVWTFVTNAIPAVCQTPGYARAVEETGHRRFSADQVQRLVQQRMDRARILDRVPYTAIFPESLLHAVKGDAAVMAEQMAHLLELCDRENVTLLVLDVEHQTAAPSEFTLLATAGQMPDLSTEGGLHSDRFGEGQVAAAGHLDLFNYLESLAYSPDESRALIAKSANRFAARASHLKGLNPR